MTARLFIKSTIYKLIIIYVTNDSEKTGKSMPLGIYYNIPEAWILLNYTKFIDKTTNSIL